jgi:hypothetical protein
VPDSVRQEGLLGTAEIAWLQTSLAMPADLQVARWFELRQLVDSKLAMG